MEEEENNSESKTTEAEGRKVKRNGEQIWEIWASHWDAISYVMEN